MTCWPRSAHAGGMESTSKPDTPVSSSGDRSPVSSSGHESPVSSSAGRSPVASSGDWSPAASSGKWSPISSSGKWSPVSSSGDWSPVASSGDRSPAASSGDWSPVSSSGSESPISSSGNRSPVSSSGDWSPVASSGNRSPVSSSGDRSPAASSGNKSHAFAAYSSAYTTGTGSVAVGVWVRLTDNGMDAVVLPRPGFQAYVVSVADGWPVWTWITMTIDGDVVVEPDVLLPDDGRGYQLSYVDGYYMAGCRQFPFNQAVEHWSDPDHDDQCAAGLLLLEVERHHAQMVQRNEWAADQ